MFIVTRGLTPNLLAPFCLREMVYWRIASQFWIIDIDEKFTC